LSPNRLLDISLPSIHSHEMMDSDISPPKKKNLNLHLTRVLDRLDSIDSLHVNVNVLVQKMSIVIHARTRLQITVRSDQMLDKQHYFVQVNYNLANSGPGIWTASPGIWTAIRNIGFPTQLLFSKNKNNSFDFASTSSNSNLSRLTQKIVQTIQNNYHAQPGAPLVAPLSYDKEK
jgi:hypothetical protein